MVAAAVLTPAEVVPATQNTGTGLTRLDASNQLMTLASNGESSLKFLQDMGKTLADSRMLRLKNPQQGAAVLLAAICEGTTPFQIMREFHIMDDGGMSMKADVMLAKFNAAGGKHQWLKTGDDGEEAVLRLMWAGQDIQVSYTIDDAKRANLIRKSGNWEKNPGEMLRARATSKGVRMVMPGIVAGIYAPEDFAESDMPAAPSAAATTRKTAAAKNTASTTAATTSNADVIDAEVEKPAETQTTQSAPFDGGTVAANSANTTNSAATDNGDSANSITAVLMEIELILGELGMTKADLEAGMKKKNPAFTTIDDLGIDQAKQILERLRAKKQASPQA